VTAGRKRATSAGVRKAANGTYWFVVDVGRDPVTGKRKQVRRTGFEKLEDARNALAKIQVETSTGTYSEPSRQPAREYLREWLDATRATREPSTHSGYRRHIETHVIPKIGGLPLAAVDAGRISKLLADLLQSGRRDGKGGLSVTTVRQIHAILHRAFGDAVRWQRLRVNPVDQVDAPKAKRGLQHNTWTGEQVALFLQRAASSRYRVAWLLAFVTGMRRGELLGLQWQDIDLEHGIVAIVRTTSLVDGKIVTAPGTKTNRGRSVKLDTQTVAELKRHRVEQAAEMLRLGIRPGGSSFVFAHPDGRPLHPMLFSREFDRAQKRTPELPRIRFHDARHTSATLALRAGVPTKVVSERLGHSSPMVTLSVYQHVTQHMQEDAAEQIAGLIFRPA
jgi:integrase